jgi:predicted nuclease with TOPRIM domain
MEIEKEILELKRRMGLAETRLGQLDGSFEFVVGQLRDIQLYMHSRFEAVDQRFDRMEARFDGLEGRFDGLEGRFDGLEGRFDGLATEVREIKSEVKALPRVIAEMIGRKP